MRKTIYAITILSILVLSACQAAPSAAPVITSPTVLRVMTHDSFSLSESVVKSFESANNVKLEFIKSGDTGSALNRAILTKSSPQADVFFGVDNTYFSRAIKEGIFQPYKSPLLASIPDVYKIDPSFNLTPVDYGDVCINYDKAYFKDQNLVLPASLEDLTNQEYKGLLVVENPATSSPGLAFLLATIAQYGETGYLDYWQRLAVNGVVIVNDWNTAYYTNFSASSGKGAQPMVVSYASSPAAEVIFAETELTESPTASLVSKNMCFRQVEFVGILTGTQNLDLAKKFIDAMISLEMQNDIPLQMFVYPVNKDAILPDAFTKFAQVPQYPAAISADQIDQNREKWIQDWSSLILK